MHFHLKICSANTQETAQIQIIKDDIYTHTNYPAMHQSRPKQSQSAPLVSKGKV